MPSLHGSRPTHIAQEDNEDEMDWTPTNPDAASSSVFGGGACGSNKRSNNDTDLNWLRPQKFFAPEKPTGLEGLLESARIQDEPMPYLPPEHSQRGSRPLMINLTSHLRKWSPGYTLLLAVVVAVSVKYNASFTTLTRWLGFL